MQCRTYQSASLDEGRRILSQEWSRHALALPRGDALRLRFSIRSLTPDTSLSRLAYGAPVQVRPEERADVLLLQMPLGGSGLVGYAWGSQPLDADHYALIDVPQVSQVLYSGALDMLVLRIRKARLQAQLAQALGRRPERPLVFEPRLARGSAAWEAWQPVVATLGALQYRPEVHYPQGALDAIETLALETLLHSQPHNHTQALQRPGRAPAPRHVRLAEDYIHAHLAQPLATAEIARHAGVSVRALFDAFRRFRGTTPAAYVREARLAAAREELLRSLLDVAEVARRWGFAHAGHFSEQYRRRYGETPQQSRRRHPTLH